MRIDIDTCEKVVQSESPEQQPRKQIPAPEVVGAALRSSDGPKKRSSAWEVLDTTSLPGRTALVTGANSGFLAPFTGLQLRNLN